MTAAKLSESPSQSEMFWIPSAMYSSTVIEVYLNMTITIKMVQMTNTVLFPSSPHQCSWKKFAKSCRSAHTPLAMLLQSQVGSLVSVNICSCEHSIL